MSDKAIKNVSIVSLSSGILGEPFIEFEKNIGVRRLEEFDLNVKFMPHALSGLEYIKDHPEARARDLLDAFMDPETDMILCAIGGDDTYRMLPYLFEHEELKKAATDNKKAATDKVFLGYSDTTINHFMLHKVGLRSFYGQAFLPDICELAPDMLPYTEKYFRELITTGTVKEVTPSDVWYEERTEFSPDQVGTMSPSHPNKGFELLQGPAQFSGKILGGCIESMYECFSPDRYEDMPVLCRRYHLFPEAEDWKDRIILLETSEERPSPDLYRKALECLKEEGVFDAVSGILAGKPQDEVYAEEYKKLLVEVTDDPGLPILFDVNVGHANPRCIIPFGVEATVDADSQIIRFTGHQIP